MTNRDKAIKLLTHYFQVTWVRKYPWTSDNMDEMAELVDLLMGTARRDDPSPLWDWKRFFEQCGYCVLRTRQESITADIDIDTLYSMFKARMDSENNK